MRVARYVGNGEVSIVDEPTPTCPPGGLLVQTEACGLCSGELMSWYMDRKIPHVLGHEVSGRVIASEDPRFEVGQSVFPHHHAPCLKCEWCGKREYVHCAQWKRTKLIPGGMAEVFAVPAENLNDTLITDDLRPIDAALIEPLACVMKSIRMADLEARSPLQVAVVGLGVMGLLHLIMLSGEAVGYDLNPVRRAHAESLGLRTLTPESQEPADVVFVCPGSQSAFDFAIEVIKPCGTIVMFAPLSPGENLNIPQAAYFQDLTIRHAYSCGPQDTATAAQAIREGRLRAEQVVSDFISLDELPKAYGAMKSLEILKPMVVF